MKDFERYYRIVSKSGETTGQKPSVWQYVLLRLADNFAVVLLTAITLFLASIGLLLPRDNQEASRWALDAAKLCLGVLLGLFAGKKRA
jgi:hypothetical protein